MATPTMLSGTPRTGLRWRPVPEAGVDPGCAVCPHEPAVRSGVLRSSSVGRNSRHGTKVAGLQEEDNFYDAFLAPLEARMLRSVWRIVHDRQLAQDALQDAFAVVWRRREQVRRHPNPEALILRICLNVSCDAIRRQMRLRRREAPAEMIRAGEATSPATSSGTGDSILGDEVRTALALLSRNQAAAVLLRLIHEQRYAEIAETLGCSQTTARIHVMRGRARLRRLLAHARSEDPGKECKPR